MPIPASVPMPRPPTHPIVTAATGMVWADSALVTLGCAHSALVAAIPEVGDRAPCILCRIPAVITSVVPLASVPSLAQP